MDVAIQRGRDNGALDGESSHSVIELTAGSAQKWKNMRQRITQSSPVTYLASDPSCSCGKDFTLV
jgi:hypothetical protein